MAKSTREGTEILREVSGDLIRQPTTSVLASQILGLLTHITLQLQELIDGGEEV